VTPWTNAEKLAFEKELLGFYVTGHPLDDYRPALESGKYTPIASLAEQEDKSTVSIAGALTLVEKKFTKKGGKPFAVVALEDLTGSLEVMVWNEAFSKSSQLLELGNVVTISGRLDLREEGPRISANEVKALKKPEPREKALLLKLDQAVATEGDLDEIRRIITEHPGKRRVELRIKAKDGRQIRLVLGAEFSVASSPETQHALGRWL
jgi:DNA polymerase-3 subunit alpha